MPGKTIIISGDRAAGKTTYATRICDLLESKYIPYAAILSPGFFETGDRTHYKLRCRPGQMEAILCQRDHEPGYLKGGGFWFNPAAIKAGIEHIEKAAPSSQVVLIDEIGRLEAEGMVWAPLLHASASWNAMRILCIRTPFIPLLMNILHPDELHIVDAGSDFVQMITLLQSPDIL